MKMLSIIHHDVPSPNCSKPEFHSWNTKQKILMNLFIVFPMHLQFPMHFKAKTSLKKNTLSFIEKDLFVLNRYMLDINSVTFLLT